MGKEPTTNAEKDIIGIIIWVINTGLAIFVVGGLLYIDFFETFV